MTIDQAAPATAPRRTRPRNRRALIVAAATDLIARRGYDQIGMGDIAEAVGIRPSSLYRHFTGKQDLLREVLTEAVVPARDVLADLDLRDRATALPRLSALMLDHRPLGVLWQREARHLTPADDTAIRAQVRDIGHLLASQVRAARSDLSAPAADLLARSITAVLTSVSYHHLTLPRPDYDQFLAGLVGVVLDTAVADDFTDYPRQPGGGQRLTPRSRREALLAQATRMFARQGYSNVSLEDIGAALGLTGPSIYKHFDSKRDLLVTAYRRGSATAFMDLAAIYDTATAASDALNRLVCSYLRFALQHHDLIDLMITQANHLPEDEFHAARQAQRDYISEWTHLLRTVNPEVDPIRAQIRVQAAIIVVNDAVRTPLLRHNPAVAPALTTLCTRLLLT